MIELRRSHSKSTLWSLPDLDYDEFLPVVIFDRENFDSLKSASIQEKDEIVELSEKLDAGSRRYRPYQIIVAPGTLTIPFKVEWGKKTRDSRGILNIQLTGNNKGARILSGDTVSCSIGNTLEVEVEIPNAGDLSFNLEFYANDNPDDLNVGESKNVFCGQMELVVYSDVFTSEESNRLISEIQDLAPFARAHSPEEYFDSYCMMAAERGLSKLLGNTRDFYNLDKFGNRNGHAFSKGENAISRGTDFLKKGYVVSHFKFDEYKTNKKLLLATKNDIDYERNLYKIISIEKDGVLKSQLNSTLSNKPGNHYFYLSITHAFHTLILHIDNQVENHYRYAIYDQDGKSTSFGKYEDIELGFAQQTSWTFLNFYKNSGYNPNKTSGKESQLWKIQRKPP